VKFFRGNLLHILGIIFITVALILFLNAGAPEIISRELVREPYTHVENVSTPNIKYYLYIGLGTLSVLIAVFLIVFNFSKNIKHRNPLDKSEGKGKTIKHQLNSIKDLFDKGFISEAEYNELRTKLLGITK
jgi:uncharacterized membrane protein